MDTKWHLLSVEETLSKLTTSSHGISRDEALARLIKHGRNDLPKAKTRSVASTFASQFNSPLIFVLVAAGGAIYLIGETTDALIILTILIFNAIVGTIQEGRAVNVLSALKMFVETKAVVVRDGSPLVIPDYEVVPGDIIDLREGEKVPADARLIASLGLKADEASLTGESEPVEKITEVQDDLSAIIADQRNMIFKGTHIVSGEGKAVVVATGSSTEIGKVARRMSTIDTEIPLKTDIRNLSRMIILVTGVVSLLLFVLGIAYGQPTKTMFTTVVSLAVSVIPEGLPIVMTLVLATGVWRMGKQNALVKKLQAVEALGQARVIAVDKTGTITKNEMVVREVWTDGSLFEIGGIGYEDKGDVSLVGNIVDAANHPALLKMGKLIALCSDARVSYSDLDKKWQVTGDPTDAAMVILAGKIGFHKEDLVNESPVITRIPFDHMHKYRAVKTIIDNREVLVAIGAPEVIVSSADNTLLEEVVTAMSEKGQRVLAVGIMDAKHWDSNQTIEGITLVGFVGMKDVLRPEVKDAMARAKLAGVRVVMITGDHKITARSIGREAGIYTDGDTILTGIEIDRLTDRELEGSLSLATIFARVTPEHKLRIIDAFKRRGEIVAMTGDGVNDAPSLVAADLGVAMGGIGTEVAREAADIVLLDDNFGSIVTAIEEGRSIYKTIKKVILYLFSTSLGEVLTIAGGLLLGLPLPLLAAQIIWLNFVTDGFLDVALAMEPKEKGLLLGKFERSKKYLVDRLMLVRMIVMALPMMIGTLVLFSKYLDVDPGKAWTISLTLLAVFQWFNAWNCRSDTKSIFTSNPFSNKYLIGATAVVIILQILAVYTPFLQKVLHTVPLSLSDWLIIIPVAFSIVVFEEARKLFMWYNSGSARQQLRELSHGEESPNT